MKRLLFVLVSVGCFAGDHQFSGTTSERHQEMSDYYTPPKQELPWWHSPYMTGDWWGARAKMAEKGITFGLSYVDDMAANLSGGEAKGFANAGSFGFDMNVDFSRFSSLQGLSFYTSVVWRIGTSLSADKIGNQYPVQQVYGGQNVRLNELYLKQVLFDEYLILKGGRLNGGNDFLQSQLYYQFMNNGFNGNPISIFFNTPFTAYPNATWGFFMQFHPYFKRILVKAAAYVAQDDVAANRYHGFNWSFNGSDGAFLISEWAYQVNQLKGETGYPGNYRIGGYYTTGSHGQKYCGGSYHGNYGTYVLIDQMVYRHADSDRGLTPFVAIVFAPKDRNLFPFFIASGLVYKGLFAARPNDSTNLGFIYGKYSTAMRDAQENAKRSGIMSPFGNMPQNFEALVELNYSFQINPWFVLMPDLQYVINPKGFGTIENAWVIGAQISLTL